MSDTILTGRVAVGQHVLCSGLRGFTSSTLRCQVTRVDGAYVWVTTADLADAGTPLVLDASQAAPLCDTVPAGFTHASGLVVLA